MAFIRFTDRPAFRNPWLEFERIRQGLDELAHSYTDQDRGRMHANVYPALNVFEETDKMVITAEMPGVKPEDLEVSLQGDTLTVQGIFLISYFQINNIGLYDLHLNIVCKRNCSLDRKSVV